MNKEQLQGKFSQLGGRIKETWGGLSDDDIMLLNGKREQFFGKLQEIYGIDREEAEKRLQEIEKTCAYISDHAA